MSPPIKITDVKIENPVSLFSERIYFQIKLECSQALEEDLDWKLIYVGSAENSENDQVLADVAIGPVIVGNHGFQLPCDPPSLCQLRDPLEVTVMLLIGTYKEREFFRVGYWVKNERTSNIDISSEQSLIRNICVNKPRVSTPIIDWDEPNPELIMTEEEMLGDVNFFVSEK
eukprot:TRINITY_DN464_c0_g1_i4.p1 TRINITY_DN464_c0_g1~~TRINITY_DN464_c0_g1_i4.p1  ORF type:complete len:172 (+),score=8.73 TRINITY_DN464_c0_g1_i4:75-590(+)